VNPLSSSVENTNQRPNRRFSNPTKTYIRNPPHNCHVVKSLFGGRLPLSPMAQNPWVSNVFKPLDMSAIPGYPYNMPQNFEKWLPKFFGNDVTIVKEHLDKFWNYFLTHPINDEDEYIVMRLFSATFVEDARRWYNSLLDKGIKNWDAFHKVFMKIWGTKGDPNMLLLQLSEMKNKENENVKEFDTRFENLLQRIPDNIIPKSDALIFVYVNSYLGKFGLMIKEKRQMTLEEAKEQAA
jgi:hypothetical protein